MRQLTSLDAQFLALENPRVYGHVSGLAIYDPSTAPGGTLTRDDLVELIGQRLHLLPPFRWKLAKVPFDLDHPYWVEDPDFDLDFHVRESAVPPPGDRKQLAETVARIVARPLDRRRPLWTLYLIHGLEGGRAAVLTKIHHAAIDGVSGAEVLSILLDFDPGGREIPPPEREFGEPVPGPLTMLARGVAGLPRQPVRALKALPSALPALDELPLENLPGGRLANTATRTVRRVTGGVSGDGGILEQSRSPAPHTRFNGRISPHRRFAFGSLSLPKVKAIKNALGITVNDVVIGLCATGLRDWLTDLDELPVEPLVAMVPVSVRAPDQQGTFGNRVSAMFTPIPTNEPDTRKRLMAAHESMSTAKGRHNALPATMMQDVSNFVPPALSARAARVTAQLAGSSRTRPLFNLTISNVPGPPTPLYLAGAELEAHYPVSVIADGIGLNITVLSYRDHLDFGIVADREQVDDIWPLMDCIERALDEIDREICGQATTEDVMASTSS